MPHRQRTASLTMLKPLALGLALAFGATASAEESPYYIGVSQAFTHDSNVLHSTNNERGDTISSTGVLGGIDLKPGRQHVFGNLSAQANRHQHFDALDNTSYDAAAGLDWQTIEHLSGALQYSTKQNLVNFADVSVPVGTKDVQKTQHASASVRYGITSQFGLEGSASHRTVVFSNAEDKRGFTQRVGSAGVRWGGTGILTVGVSLRDTKTDTPQALIGFSTLGDLTAVPPILPVAAYGPDRSDRRDVDLTTTWSPSGLSILSARLSVSRQTHSQPSLPKFSGVTGSLGWDYKPTGKLEFKTTLARDTGSEVVFSEGLNLFPLRTSNDRLNTLASLEAKYEATAKILVDANIKYDRGFIDALDVSKNGSRSTTSYGIGAKYLASRAITLGCNLNQERRSHTYEDTVASCSAQFVLR